MRNGNRTISWIRIPIHKIGHWRANYSASANNNAMGKRCEEHVIDLQTVRAPQSSRKRKLAMFTKETSGDMPDDCVHTYVV